MFIVACSAFFHKKLLGSVAAVKLYGDSPPTTYKVDAFLLNALQRASIIFLLNRSLNTLLELFWK